MFHSISAVVVLYSFWLLLSGYFTAFLMISGLGCALAVVGFARRMDLIDREGHPIHLGWRAVTYWPWLVKEIVKSAWQVTRIILDPALPISPTLVRLKPAQRTDVGLVAHANSITLTPGTLTLEAADDHFLVHALTEEGGEDLLQGAIDRRVAAMEGDR
ncbi:MAG TPA: Na+/H+ antiporter subunit E [Burkholderiales bacterium]|jgi:multicomponent Na+:H+ antiporter subunit E|nr:Na+/H+ antiporter subunit E [Burkholderiales bacterium]